MGTLLRILTNPIILKKTVYLLILINQINMIWYLVMDEILIHMNDTKYFIIITKEEIA